MRAFLISLLRSIGVAALAVCAGLGPALANETLSNTDIVLNIRGDNAAIDSLASFGFDNFDQGTHVSDWGLMIDGVAATFQINRTSGGGIPFGVLSNSGGIISATASYSYGAYAITVTRQYQIVGPSSVLVTTTIQNTGQSIANFLGYDTFDPDIGIPRSGPFATYNDVLTDSGILIGLASDTVTTGYSVALGVADPRAVVAAGFPFQIDSASSLTGVAAAPFDGNGALADEGLHIVFSTALASGGVTSFQYFLNFGTSPAGALSALLSAMAGVCPTSSAADTCFLTAASNQILTIDAQGGSDTLQLGGTTNYSFDAGAIGTKYTNFEVFQKTGASTVTLTGTAGLTTLGFDVQSGRLIAGAGTLGSSGANSVGAGATLEIAGNNAIANLSGAGALSLGASAQLTTGDASSTLFSGSSSGAGGVTKSGSGTFTLTGANTFSGALDVASGNLTVTSGGSLANMSSFNIANGASAFLGGTVQGVNGGGMTAVALGAVTVNSGATLYLDDNTAISATSATFAPGATFAAFFTTDTTQHASIAVSGSAALAGAFVAYLDPVSFAGTTQTSFLYTGVISGPVTGTFSSLSLQGAPPLFTINALYNSFDVLIERTSFSDLGDGNAGGAIEQIYQNGTGDPDLLNLIQTIAQNPGAAGAIYDAIGGSTQAETDQAAMRSDDPWKQSVAQRTDAARSTGCTVAGDTWCFRRYAQAPAPVQTDAAADSDAFAWLETGLRDEGATSVWGRVVGVWGQTDGGPSSPGSHQRTYGLVAGADRVVDATLLVGVAGQYVQTTADFEGSRNASSIEAFQGGAYFSHGGAAFYVNGNLSAIATRSTTERFFTVGAIDYEASVRFPATTVSAALETGAIYEAGGYRLEPNIAISFAAQFTDEYREAGAGGLGLIVDPRDNYSLRSSLGGRVSRVYDLGDRKIVPELRADWRHEYLDRRQTFEAAFQGAPGTSFLVSCEPSARDTLALGASLTLPLAGRVTGYIDAEGAFSEDARSGTISLGARATW